MKIRAVDLSDADKMRQYYSENRFHFKAWEPIRSADFHSLDEWEKRIIEYVDYQRRQEAFYFIAIIDDCVVAQCNLTEIARGAFQACYMAYSVAKHLEGKGIAHKLCREVITYAFDELGLHRIMANYMPHNNRSAKLLSRLGFVKEGVAKDYLKIAGKWENHVLTSLTNTAG